MQRVADLELPHVMNGPLMKNVLAASCLVMGASTVACAQAPADKAPSAVETDTSAASIALRPSGQAEASTSGAQAAAFVWSQDPVSKCRFVAPRSLPVGAVSWEGTCTGGKASGLGMLRRREGGKGLEAFYGEFREGVPTIGVIDMTNGDQGGLIAGRFINDDVGQGEVKWQDRADAFNVATSAARAVSMRFKAQNNLASANFYEQQAKMLGEQIE